MLDVFSSSLTNSQKKDTLQYLERLRVRRDWQHAMKAKGEAGMGAMVYEMEESFKKSPKLYGSILIGIALTMILTLIAMTSVLFGGRGGAIKRKEE